MDIRNARDIPQLVSEHGEIVQEMFGNAGKNAAAHSLAQITLPPNTASLKHYHPIAEESYYILSGKGRVEIDGESAEMSLGDSVIILAEQVHQIFNDHAEELVFLAVCVPAWTPDNSVFLD